MTEKITKPITPDVLAPVPLGKLSGNWADNDNPVYEDDFDHAPSQAQEYKGVEHVVPKITPNTRLLSRTVTVGTVNGAIADPIPIINPDPNRENVTIIVNGAAATTFRIGSEKTDCYNGNDIPAQAAPILLDKHTGALWAYSTSGTPVIISVIAVTK